MVIKSRESIVQPQKLVCIAPLAWHDKRATCTNSIKLSNIENLPDCVTVMLHSTRVC